MAQKIFLFNPDNDLALAHAGGYYTAPKFAQKMQNDLCTLPMWYAPEGSMVLVSNAKACEWLEATSAQHHLSIKGITAEDLPKIHDAEFRPWGWSGAMKQRLINLGVTPGALPTDSKICEIRNLSHRRSTIAMSQYIKANTSLPLSPTPTEKMCFQDAQDFAISNPGSYIKMPWSGSGQGIYHAIDPTSPEFERWCRGAIKRQGAVMCEVGLNRLLDFALEFECADGKAEFIGYSVFESDSHSQYNCGIVASKEYLHSRIAAKYPLLHQIVPIVAQAVSHIFAKHYSGYAGVDMLLYTNADGETMLDPCVEVNLRATMGLVTCKIGEKFLNKGSIGKFKIEYSKGGFSKQLENRIYLTPIFSDTQYCAYVDLLD